MILKLEKRAARIETALDANLVFRSPGRGLLLLPFKLEVEVRRVKLAATRVKALISRQGQRKLASPHLVAFDPLTAKPAHIGVERVGGRPGGRLSSKRYAQPL